MCRLLTLALAAALTLIAAPAQAELVTDDGWTAAPALPGSSVDQLAHVDETHWVTQHMGSEEPWCTDGLVAAPLGSVFEPFYQTSTYRLAMRPGGDLYTLTWGARRADELVGGPWLIVVRASCTPAANEDITPPAQGGGFGTPAFDPYFLGPIPTRADGTTYLPTVDGLYALDLDAPAAPTLLVSKRAVFDALMATHPDAFGVEPAFEAMAIGAGAVTPRDQLWLLVEQGIGSESFVWLAEVGRDGTVSVVVPPAELRGLGISARQSLVVSGELDAAVLDGARRWWLVPLDADERARIERRPWIATTTDGSPALPLLPADDGHFALGLRRVSLDVDRLDPDRDLLTWAEESARGLSPRDDDSDGDHLSDGTEVHFLASDASDPSSPGLAAPEPVTLAPSTMLYEWAFMNQPYTQNGVVATGYSETALCSPMHGSIGVPLSDYDCRWRAGTPVFSEPPVTEPRLTADGEHAYFFGDGLEVMDIAAGQSRPIPGGTMTSGLYPIADDLAFQVPNDPRKLLRHDGAGTFAVVDLARTECPFLGSEAQRGAVCSASYQRLPGGLHAPSDVTVLGYHARLDGLVIQIEGARGAVLMLADRDSVRPLVHESFFGGRRLTSVAALPSGALVGRFDVPDSPAQLAVFDDALGAHAVQATPLAPEVSHVFRDGFFDVAGYAYYELPPATGETGGCTTVGGITMCAFDAPDPERLDVVQAVNHREWVPVPRGLERGEGIFWAGGLRQASGSFVTTYATDWALWRVTRLGGVHRWIDAAAFGALLDADDRAALMVQPLREVVVTAAAADPWRMCFVEEQLNRVGRAWEITFDQTTRVPSGAALVAQGDVISCGYDGDVRIIMRDEAVGGLTKAVLDFEDGREIRVGYFGAKGFVRMAEHWLILGVSAPACVQGSTDEPRFVENFNMLHATYANGLLYWIRPDGRGFVSEEAHVCTDQGGATESMHWFAPPGDPTPFWTRVARNRYGTNPWQATVRDATIALRPDGVMLVAPEGLGAMGSDVPLPDFYKDMLHRFSVTYTPTNWDFRIEALDAKRRGETRVEAMSIDAVDVRALSVVPWTEEWPELGWEYLGGEKPPPKTRPGTEPELEPEPPAEPSTGGDDGCAGGGGAGWLVVLVVLARRRRGSARA